jgi:hypothetical protein
MGDADDVWFPMEVWEHIASMIMIPTQRARLSCVSRCMKSLFHDDVIEAGLRELACMICSNASAKLHVPGTKLVILARTDERGVFVDYIESEADKVGGLNWNCNYRHWYTHVGEDRWPVKRVSLRLRCAYSPRVGTTPRSAFLHEFVDAAFKRGMGVDVTGLSVRVRASSRVV